MFNFPTSFSTLLQPRRIIYHWVFVNNSCSITMIDINSSSIVVFFRSSYGHIYITEKNKSQWERWTIKSGINCKLSVLDILKDFTVKNSSLGQFNVMCSRVANKFYFAWQYFQSQLKVNAAESQVLMMNILYLTYNNWLLSSNYYAQKDWKFGTEPSYRWICECQDPSKWPFALKPALFERSSVKSLNAHWCVCEGLWNFRGV